MKNRKISSILPLMTCCALPCAAALVINPLTTTSAHAQALPISILHNGRLMKFDVPPVEMNGRVLVPLRGVFEGLGASVDFDPATNNIFATRGTTQIQLRIGTTQASVNGISKILDVPAQTYNNRTLVPLRFVSEALGAKVDWNNAQRAVYITADDEATPPVTPPTTVPEPQLPPGGSSEATTTITGTVTRLRPNGRSFDVQTDAGEQVTVRLDVAPTGPPQEGDRVQVSGVMRGNLLNVTKDQIVFLDNGAKTTLFGRIVSFQDNDDLMIQSRGTTYTVHTNGALPDGIKVGDTVRVSGIVNGTVISDARVRPGGRPGGGRGNNDGTGNNNGANNGGNDTNNDTPTANTQTVSFTGSVERVNAAARTLQVKGDNGQSYTINYNDARNFTRGDRVRVEGDYADGVTTATSVTRVDQ